MPAKSSIAQIAVRLRPFRFVPILTFCLLVGIAAWIGIRNDIGEIGDVAGALKTCGNVFGILAAMLLMLQFGVSARFQILDRFHGLDKMFRFHRVMGATAGVFAGLHPIILSGTGVVDQFAVLRWAEWIGAAALLLVATIVCTSLWRVFLGLRFETWRVIHQLAFVAVVVVTVHSQILGGEVNLGWPRYFWFTVVAAYAATFVWVKFVKPARLRKRHYVVVDVREAARNVTNLTLRPSGGEVFDYMPGQFAFITLKRKGFATEEHHFTLTSSPARRDTISFTIKASGDFTGTINQTKTGDIAYIDGPYGQFSHVMHSQGNLVMIAGGIGITPFLGMLRYMADTGDKRAIVLIWGNQTEKDIVFREEFETLKTRLPNLRICHVMSAQPEWPGEKSKVDESLLERVLADCDPKTHVFLCGPPPMMDLVTAALAHLKFCRSRIHTERFQL